MQHRIYDQALDSHCLCFEENLCVLCIRWSIEAEYKFMEKPYKDRVTADLLDMCKSRLVQSVTFNLQASVEQPRPH